MLIKYYADRKVVDGEVFNKGDIMGTLETDGGNMTWQLAASLIMRGATQIHQKRGYILINDYAEGKNNWKAGSTVAWVTPSGKLSPRVLVAMINEGVAKPARLINVTPSKEKLGKE